MAGFIRPERTIFDADHLAFGRTVRAFAASVSQDRRDRWSTDGVIDRDFWRQAAALGLVGFSAPEEFGGLGIDDFRYSVVVDEEIVRSGLGTDAFTMTNDIVGPYLWERCTREQSHRWLPGVLTGDLVVAIAMSEPGAGSDLRGIRTTAVDAGDHYVLNGSKTFVTSGIQADLVVVAAQIDVDGSPRITLLVVEAGMPGFQKGRKLEKVGRRSQDTAELFFNDVEVPKSNVLGAVGGGFEIMMANLPQERLSMAVTALANAEYVLEMTTAYAAERHAFGQPIGTFQHNRFTIAEMATEVRVGRAYVDSCIMRHAAHALDAAEAAGAKFWATELEWRVVDQCLQLYGGYGYMEEYDIARRWRDARVQRIYGGTSEIMREIVGRSLGF